MLQLTLAIGVLQPGEGQLPPYFWARLLVGTLLVALVVRVLDRLIRIPRTGSGPNPARRFIRMRRRRRNGGRQIQAPTHPTELRL